MYYPSIIGVILVPIVAASLLSNRQYVSTEMYTVRRHVLYKGACVDSPCTGVPKNGSCKPFSAFKRSNSDMLSRFGADPRCAVNTEGGAATNTSSVSTSYDRHVTHQRGARGSGCRYTYASPLHPGVHQWGNKKFIETDTCQLEGTSRVLDTY